MSNLIPSTVTHNSSDTPSRLESSPRANAAGLISTSLQFPARLILGRSVLLQIPAGVFLISARLRDDGTPVFAKKVGPDLKNLWHEILHAGAAGCDCIIIADRHHFEVLATPIALDSCGRLSMREICRRDQLLNRLFPPAARMAS